MASPCSIRIDTQDERAARQAAKAAIAEVQRIETKYSRYQAGSVVSRINQGAGQAAVEVDAETRELLAFAHALWEMSDGLFDISSGVLRRAWNFRSTLLPSAEAVQDALACVGWQKVELHDSSVRLSQAGMELDFGGFGKEYAADRAAAVLGQHGQQHALVNLGGDLHALGPRAVPELRGAPWRIQIAHPRPEAAHDTPPLASLNLTRGGLASSGDYERFLVHEGKRYCHVLNPLTGWPVTHWQSISVLATNTTTAGALTTIAMLKEQDAVAWLTAQDARYLGVLWDGSMVQSPAQ